MLIGTTAIAALTALALTMAACGPSVPPTPEEDERLNEAKEALFWGQVKVVGLSETLPFDQAKLELVDVLFNIFDEHLTKIEGIGIDPFQMWPYCITAISSMTSLDRLTQGESPAEAAIHSNFLFELARNLDLELTAARQDERQLTVASRERCDDLYKELIEQDKGSSVNP